MAGFTLDTGALIAVERRERRVTTLLKRAIERGEQLRVPAGVVAQAWRDPHRQVLLVRLLTNEGVRVEPLDDRGAKEAGQLCGATQTADIVDASVVICARAHEDTVITSDPEDIRRLDPLLEIIEV